MTFVGWLSHGQGFRATASLGFGSTASGYPALTKGIEVLGCANGWTTVHGIRIYLTATGEAFETYTTDGGGTRSYEHHQPDPSTIVVHAMAAGYIGDNDIGAGCEDM
jgi:hypothetical protein